MTDNKPTHEDELKACPFCGGEADDRHELIIECRNNDCLINPSQCGFESNAEARAAWNTRAPDRDSYNAGFNFAHETRASTPPAPQANMVYIEEENHE